MNPNTVLRNYYGYSSFREGQFEIISNILNGKDTLAIMPTGGGKSICFQIPALCMSGITLVISPLISLMKDQVDALNTMGIHAAYINSLLKEAQINKALQNAKQGAYKIIYVAPERLNTPSFLSFVEAVEISMITVDEAHCISQWGQDFRPSYLKILEFIEKLPKRPILSCFTATATKEVREDILCILKLQNPFVQINGFDRKNLFFQVEHRKNKNRFLLDYIQKHKGESGIIYCSTRKNVENVYEFLREEHIQVGRYHAGMGIEDRKKEQDDFIQDRTSIIVATNAFGMGIDKSNVRFVIHYNMPSCIENYYQEAGRAGRDGEKSNCILLYSGQDSVIQRFLIENKVFNEQDEEISAAIKEKDLLRLKKMESYCQTENCLRNFILNYFGQVTNISCDNCGNCLKVYETEDRSEEARTILNCIYEANQRYGVNVIIQTLRGSQSEKVKQYHTNTYRTYGKLKDVKEDIVREWIYQLIQQGYIRQTEDSYRVLQFGPKMKELKHPNAKVFLRKNEQIQEKEENSDKLNTLQYSLFLLLKETRLKIAREEGKPPYIIFGDATLKDMAKKAPTNTLEFLKVSGVGEVKEKKYGKSFRDVILHFAMEHPEIKPSKKGKKTTKMVPFYLTQEQAKEFLYQEEMTGLEIKGALNMIKSSNCKDFLVKDIADYFESIGWLEKYVVDNHVFLKTTQLGLEHGILNEEKISKKGIPYSALSYGKEAQEKLIQYLISIRKENIE
ncbi:MAG: DNA helicase RecQ [Firmicutes bacterium]|nr:DNA helicase RecQ [Bacillota bacterium]